MRSGGSAKLTCCVLCAKLNHIYLLTDSHTPFWICGKSKCPVCFHLAIFTRFLDAGFSFALFPHITYNRKTHNSLYRHTSAIEQPRTLHILSHDVCNVTRPTHRKAASIDTCSIAQTTKQKFTIFLLASKRDSFSHWFGIAENYPRIPNAKTCSGNDNDIYDFCK